MIYIVCGELVEVTSLETVLFDVIGISVAFCLDS